MKINWKLGVALGILFCLGANVQAQPADTAPLVEAKPEAKIKVWVLGDVVHPGRYEVPDQHDFIAVLVEAGGISKAPKSIRAMVVRGKVRIAIDLKKLFLGDAASNLKLHDGDVVVVSQHPEPLASTALELLATLDALDKAPAGNQIRVSGAVRKGGTFPWPTQGMLTLREALNLAGGFTSILQQEKAPDGTLTYKVMNAYIRVNRWINGQKTSVLEWDNVNGSPDARWDILLQKGDEIEVLTASSPVRRSKPSSPRQASPQAYLWLLSSG